MNLLYIHTHDSGRMLQPYDPSVPTPHLQALADESILFRHAFCTAPTCSPSRAGMLSGCAPHCTGMLGLAHRGFALTDPKHHLSHYLADCGYYCGLVGIQHEMPKERVSELGYHEIHLGEVPPAALRETRDPSNLPAVRDFLTCAKERKQPFFLSYGMFSTHREYPALTEAEEAQSARTHVPYPQPDLPEVRRDFRAYQKSAAIADRCVGEVLSMLKELDLADDTIVLYTTDHGIAFPNMKCTLYDSGIGVALLLHDPRLPAATCDALVSHVDVFPTLCDLLGLPHPAWLQGRSLLPLLTGEGNTAAGDDYVFAEVTFHAAYEPMRAVRSAGYKLIRHYGDFAQRVPANTDDSPSKDVYFSTPIAKQPRPREEFYDLTADAGERNNLIDDPAYSAIIAEHRAALDAWMLRTDDPLLRTARPEELATNIKLNPVTDYSPKTKPRIFP